MNTVLRLALLVLGTTYWRCYGASQGNEDQYRRAWGQEVLILDEQFNDFNLNFWKHEITMGGGGNWEFQMYTNNRSNSYVEDGMLYIQPTLTQDYLSPAQVGGDIPTTFDLWGLTPPDQCTSNMFYGCSRTSNRGARIAINPVQSARVRTAGTFSFKYGRVEVEAKMPRGDWLWPAIWLLPENNVYGQWPASGEIDILESRGNGPSYGTGQEDLGGCNMVSSAVHWGPHYSMDRWRDTYGVMKEGEENCPFAEEFHTYGLFWDEHEMFTYLDTEDQKILYINFDGDEEGQAGFWEKGGFAESAPHISNPWKGESAAAPYNQEFYIVMNVAVGGVSGFFPDGEGGKMWDNSDYDSAMKFFEATDDWFSTWHGKDAALQVKSVRVWQTEKDYFLTERAGHARTAAFDAVSNPPESFSTPTEPSSSVTSPLSTDTSWFSGKAIVIGLCGMAVGAALMSIVIRLQQGEYQTLRNGGGIGSGSV